MNGLAACKRQDRTTGAGAMLAQSVADILRDHVKLSVEAIDRMYFNGYVPRLQTEQGIVWFFLQPSRPNAAVGRTDGSDQPPLRVRAGKLCGPAWACARGLPQRAAQG